MEFARGPLARFLASPSGRLLRIVSGLVLLILGRRMSGIAGVLVATVGIVPLAAGSFDFCLVSRLVGGPLSGKEIRESGQYNEEMPLEATSGEVSVYA